MGIIETKKVAAINLDEESRLRGIEIYAVITLRVNVEDKEVIIKRKTESRDVYPVYQNGEWMDNLDEKEKSITKEISDILKVFDAYEKIFNKLKEKGYKLEFDIDC